MHEIHATTYDTNIVASLRELANELQKIYASLVPRE
jgi:hypothetical protein